MDNYYNKYIKYKIKYLEFKVQQGGQDTPEEQRLKAAAKQKLEQLKALRNKPQQKVKGSTGSSCNTNADCQRYLECTNTKCSRPIKPNPPTTRQPTPPSTPRPPMTRQPTPPSTPRPVRQTGGRK